jgi:hypothetical protein
MDPMTMMMLAKGVSSGIPALTQAGIGIWQNKKANDLMENLVDPVYEIPEAAKDSLSLARNNAGSRMMSGQTQAQQMLDQNYANTSEDIMEAAGSSNDALGALVKANANMQGSQNELSMKAAQDYEKRQLDLTRALAMMAGYEDKKFQVDVIDKFNRDSTAASAFKNAAINNIFDATKTASGAAGDMVATGAGGEAGIFGDFFKQGAGKTSTTEQEGLPSELEAMIQDLMLKQISSK